MNSHGSGEKIWSGNRKRLLCGAPQPCENYSQSVRDREESLGSKGRENEKPKNQKSEIKNRKRKNNSKVRLKSKIKKQNQEVKTRKLEMRKCHEDATCETDGCDDRL